MFTGMSQDTFVEPLSIVTDAAVYRTGNHYQAHVVAYEEGLPTVRHGTLGLRG